MERVTTVLVIQWTLLFLLQLLLSSSSDYGGILVTACSDGGGGDHHYHHLSSSTAIAIATDNAIGNLRSSRSAHRYLFNNFEDEDIVEECGFQDPTEEEIAKDEARMRVWKLTTQFTYGRTVVDLKIIPLYMHILQPNFFSGLVPDYRVDEYIKYLNNAFAGSASPFVFEHVNTTRTINQVWADGCGKGATEVDFKTHLKVGGAESLNVYICPFIANSNGVKNIAGYSYLPYDGVESNVKDGIVLARSTNGDRRLNTLVHETGHFLGLYHTFAAQSCAPTNRGDAVDDTPQHISNAQAVNCHTDPSTWDTCPNVPGLDPVDNFMTYSNDNLCRTKFTPGQIYRMRGQYELYREPEIVPSVPPTPQPTASPRTGQPIAPPTEPPMTVPPIAAPLTVQPKAQPTMPPTEISAAQPTQLPTSPPTALIATTPSITSSPSESPTENNHACAFYLSYCVTTEDCCFGVCYSLLGLFERRCWLQ